MKKDTSWNNAVDWYDELLSERDTYQAKVILPNLLRLMELKRGDCVLDVGCGQGFFTREFYKKTGNAVGVDLSANLIARARELSSKKFSTSSPPEADPPLAENSNYNVILRAESRSTAREIMYHVAPGHAMTFVKSVSVDKVALVHALQNIEDMHATLAECARVLKPTGRLFIVLNHPAFRVPKASSWGWNEEKKIQYRRVDRYLSESKVKIQMHPGDAPDEYTISFHRPLQFYFKSLARAGFAVRRLEEWVSHRKSQRGPRAMAEDIARKEVPLFLALETKKLTGELDVR